MARGTLEEVEDREGDFASGMGIAIGMFIALFAVAIALFVLGQDQPRAAPAATGANARPGANLPASSPATNLR